MDRGKYGIETCCLLLALHIRYPNRVLLLRGNHEDINTSMIYGFYDECLDKYAAPDRHLIYYAFMNAFNHLPIAAIVNNSVFAMHGGISPHIKTLDDLNKVSTWIMKLIVADFFS